MKDTAAAESATVTVTFKDASLLDKWRAYQKDILEKDVQISEDQTMVTVAGVTAKKNPDDGREYSGLWVEDELVTYTNPMELDDIITLLVEKAALKRIKVEDLNLQNIRPGNITEAYVRIDSKNTTHEASIN
ncbi:MAG: hypothetical protein R3E13_00450 [Alphaproteobacteria bacterium]